VFAAEFELGGPVMYAIFGVWVLMFALILERLLFWMGAARRPAEERAAQAEHNLWRIDALAQLATSLGLFGTVLGIAQSFFSRGELAGPEVLATGLATALFTTVAGIGVFLVGQACLFIFHWLAERA